MIIANSTPARLGDAAKVDSAVGVKPPSSSDRVAAVLLVLPAASKDTGGEPGRRVFRVSLGKDLGEARIELDGRDLTGSGIQRVYPQSRPLTPTLLVAPGVTGRAPAPSRVWRQPSPVNLTFGRASTTNPNGAPIID